MSQANSVSEQLWSQGIHHLVILSSSGEVLKSSGDFASPQNQKIAAAILLQVPFILKGNEKFQRVSMTIRNMVYVATVLSGEKEHEALGVIVKYPAAALTTTTESGKE